MSALHRSKVTMTFWYFMIPTSLDFNFTATHSSLAVTLYYKASPLINICQWSFVVRARA